MKLVVATPMDVVVEVDDVRHVRAEDETGAFGIMGGHADFTTALTVSILTWKDMSGGEHHVALRGGVLTVRGGSLVEVATREAIGDDRLGRLEEAVLERFRKETQSERKSSISTARLQMATIRQIQRFMESGRRPKPQGPPGTDNLGALDGPSEMRSQDVQQGE